MDKSQGNPGGYTFYYTNTGLSKESLVFFKTRIKSILGSDVTVHISDSWKYKSHLIYGVEKFDPESVKNWNKIVLFNFTYKELSNYLYKVRFVAANYIDDKNIGLIASATSLNTVSLPKFQFLPVSNITIPYNIVKRNGHFEFDEPESTLTKDFDVVSVIESNSYKLAAVKSALIDSSKSQSRIMFIMNTFTLDCILYDIVLEDERAAWIFETRPYFRVNNPPRPPITIKKYFELEECRRKRDMVLSVWVPYIHKTTRPFIKPSNMYISIVSLHNISLSYTLMKCKNLDYLIL